MNQERVKRVKELSDRFAFPILVVIVGIAALLGITYSASRHIQREPRNHRVGTFNNTDYVFTDVDGDNSPDGIKKLGRGVYEFVAKGYEDRLETDSSTKEMDEHLRTASTRWFSAQGELEGSLK